jgi:hypothetical protein
MIFVSPNRLGRFVAGQRVLFTARSGSENEEKLVDCYKRFQVYSAPDKYIILDQVIPGRDILTS